MQNKNLNLLTSIVPCKNLAGLTQKTTDGLHTAQSKDAIGCHAVGQRCLVRCIWRIRQNICE